MYGETPLILQGAAQREATVNATATKREGFDFTTALLVGVVAAFFAFGKGGMRSIWCALLMLFPLTLYAQMPSGLTTYLNMDDWCKSTRPFGSTVGGFAPDRVLRALQKADQCNFKVVVVYPRRIYQNANGTYSPLKHRAASDAYAKVLPPDTLRKYVNQRKVLLGLTVGDDYGCAECWGGVKIPITEARDAANYAKQRMPLAPIGIRLDALKMKEGASSGWAIDYGWAQWLGTKANIKIFITPANYYKANATAAQSLGLKGMFYGINTTHCTGGSSAPCTAVQVTQWATDALNQPRNCGLLNWWWGGGEGWAGAYKISWESLFAKAGNKPFTRCRG